ncbi:MAG: hypothetical protein ACE5G9_02525 [Nitrospinales bacterium]
MSPIKEDLISAIISASQANLLGINKGAGKSYSDEHEQDVLDWIKANAATYRRHFGARLQLLPENELGIILKQVTYSTKDVGEILHDGMFFPSVKRQRSHH